jgi:transposase
MSEEAQTGLFGRLPEQVSAARPVGAPRLRKAERRQVSLRPISLEDLLPSDHRARFVSAFAERLDLSALYGAVKAVEGHPGHPPADPRLLLALWLYATVEGVGSARELDRLCREHIGFEWLCGGVGMNHTTLADFRVAHGAVLERLLVDSFAAMLKCGHASLDRVAQDGMRVRAAAGAASFRRQAALKRCRAEAAAEVARLRAELDADPAGLSRRQAAARQRAAADRERRVEAALAMAGQLAATRQAVPRSGEPDPPGPEDGPVEDGPVEDGPVEDGPVEDGPVGASAARPPPEPRVSTTDAEARVMKMPDGGFRPAFNLGFASDPRSGMIAAVTLDNSGSDKGQLRPMSERLAEAYGQRPGEHLADGGFVRLADIEALAAAGVAVFAPVPKPRDAGRDPYAPLESDGSGVAAWRRRMGSEAGKAVYKQRAATAECANAQCRNRGLLRFLVRGLEKAKAVGLWHALAHNMIRTGRLLAT